MSTRATCNTQANAAPQPIPTQPASLMVTELCLSLPTLEALHAIILKMGDPPIAEPTPHPHHQRKRLCPVWGNGVFCCDGATKNRQNPRDGQNRGKGAYPPKRTGSPTPGMGAVVVRW